MPIGVDIIGGLLTIAMYGVVIFSAYRIFTMSKEITEMKDMLKDIRRNSGPQVAAPAPTSPEALVRAVHSASYSEIIDEAIRAEQPR